MVDLMPLYGIHFPSDNPGFRPTVPDENEKFTIIDNRFDAVFDVDL
jgi:hypothetical protein